MALPRLSDTALTLTVKLPAGVRYRNEPEKSLDAMVQSGELDAMLSARPPQSLGRGIDRMIPDYRPVEEAYYRKTGVYPIMHVIALRTPVLEQYPWVAMNLLKAFPWKAFIFIRVIGRRSC